MLGMGNDRDRSSREYSFWRASEMVVRECCFLYNPLLIANYLACLERGINTLALCSRR